MHSFIHVMSSWQLLPNNQLSKKWAEDFFKNKVCKAGYWLDVFSTQKMSLIFSIIIAINEIYLPTNPQLYLPYTSNHPKSCFKSIVYGQAITVRMICSREEDVKIHMKLLQQKFEKRGYPS